jgi:hypothetical protein
MECRQGCRRVPVYEFCVAKLNTLKWQGCHFRVAQGIVAEIPEADRREAEELERKVRFFAAEPQKMRPDSPAVCAFLDGER